MELYVQKDLAKQVMPLLKLSIITSTNPLKINFRCPACGDSKKDPYLCRGWMYEKQGNMKFGCFNCDEGTYLAPFVKKYFSNVWDGFRLEHFKNRNVEKPPVAIIKPRKIIYKHHDYKSVKYLSDEHDAVKYLLNRKIPRGFFKDIYYTSHWKKCADDICSGIMRTMDNDYPRIVFPLQDKKGVFGIQGRDLANHPAKYQTILSSPDAVKVWGLSRINSSKRVFILEGILDAMFIANAVAMLGGSADPKLLKFDNKVWVLDNEPRHPDTKKRMNKLIKQGEQVMIWYNCPFKGKDVNEMIQNGASIIDINKYMWKNVYSGLMAKMKMSDWSK
jgi:hypothetical protein